MTGLPSRRTSEPVDPGLTPCPHAGELSGRVLQKLDWRFLLPAPPSASYEQLIIIGADEQLALAASTIGLAIDVRRSLAGVSGADAVAVLAGANVAPAQVAQALRPGGVLYWEVDRTRAGSMNVSPERIARRLAALGLTVEGSYALRPHPTRCELFLPLHESAALQWFLDDVYVAETLRQVVGERLVRLISGGSGRRLGRLVPFHATVATAHPRAGMTIAERGSHLAASIAGSSTAMVTDSGNRAVLLSFPAGGGAVAVIKVPKLPAFAGRTIMEQRVTDDVRQVLGDDRDAVPQPLGTFEVGPGVTAGIEAAASGSSMRRTSARWGGRWATKYCDLAAATDWITTLHRDHPVGPGTWDEARRAVVLEQPMDLFEARFGVTADEVALFEMCRVESRALDGLRLPVVWQHRDYAMSNIARSGDQVRILDWEGGRPGIPFADILRFVTSWHETVRSLRTPDQRRGGLRDLFGSIERSRDRSTRAARSALDGYACALGIDARFIAVIQIANWVELSLRRFDQQRDASNSSATSGFAASRVNNVEAGYVGLLASIRSSLFAERQQ